MPGLGQTGWGAGWVRGLKGAKAVMSPLSRPPLAPLLPKEAHWAPHPRPPHILHTGSIFGERHQVGAVCRGQPETFSACFGDAAGAGGAVLRVAGKAFYGQDPESLPCYSDLDLLLALCPMRVKRKGALKSLASQRNVLGG